MTPRHEENEKEVIYHLDMSVSGWTVWKSKVRLESVSCRQFSNHRRRAMGVNWRL